MEVNIEQSKVMVIRSAGENNLKTRFYNILVNKFSYLGFVLHYNNAVTEKHSENQGRKATFTLCSKTKSYL